MSLSRDDCRWGKKECPFGTCKIDAGVECNSFEHKPFKPRIDFKGERTCCGTIPGSEHRITRPNSKHKHTTWRNRKP